MFVLVLSYFLMIASSSGKHGKMEKSLATKDKWGVLSDYLQGRMKSRSLPIESLSRSWECFSNSQ